MMNEIDLIIAFLLGLLLIVSLVGFGSSRLKGNHRVNLPPGPWKLPLIGNIHQLLGNLPHRTLSDLAKKYGSLMHLQIGELSHVVVSSPEIAKQVLDTHDTIFLSRAHIIATKIASYDSKSIVFSPYGEYWKRLRRICNLELLSPKRVLAFRSKREEQTSDLIRWIACNEGKPINLTEKVYSLLYSTSAMAAFGKKNEDHESLQKLVTEGFKITGGFSIVDIYPSVKFLQLISRFKPSFERFHLKTDRIVQKIINDHRTNSTVKYEGAEDFVDVLLKHGDENNEFHMTDECIKAVSLDIFSAGSDTSATTVDWAMSEMMKNPSILRRAQEEVRQVFGSDGYVDENKFKDLKYMISIIKETLRLHPPIPLLFPRMNSQKLEIDGYEIPAKTRVMVNVWAINRDPNYWKDAECFQPERFLDSLTDYRGKNFEYIPFGAGMRICPGMEFGLVSTQLAIANFLFYFDWELPGEEKFEDLNMKEEFGISLKRKDDLYVIPTIPNPLPFPS